MTTDGPADDTLKSREGLLAAVQRGLDANEKNAKKWTPVYEWFRDQLKVGDGVEKGPVVAKKITDTRQIGNRCDEMAKSSPQYAVISVLNDVTTDRMLEAILKRPALATLKCVLFLEETKPTSLVIFDD